jgi:hypothetical protein
VRATRNSTLESLASRRIYQDVQVVALPSRHPLAARSTIPSRGVLVVVKQESVMAT